MEASELQVRARRPALGCKEAVAQGGKLPKRFAFHAVVEPFTVDASLLGVIVGL